mmetsp:Transcript_14718/g.21188  ORF Transcript_14718/g.21188 Transcript_14718/m.21188 type:complete len:136 (+) Transcript_14718:440-847(+)
MECLRGIRYKLRMMGVPISGPSMIYGDNMSVINNTQRPESQLKKKLLSTCYHFCRESVAMGESMTVHVESAEIWPQRSSHSVPNANIWYRSCCMIFMMCTADTPVRHQICLGSLRGYSGSLANEWQIGSKYVLAI